MIFSLGKAIVLSYKYTLYSNRNHQQASFALNIFFLAFADDEDWERIVGNDRNVS